MREDLLGYLLGALEPDEMQRVERALHDDPLLQAELRQLQRMLRPLEDGGGDREEFQPPPGLVSRTMDLIESVDPVSAPAPRSHSPASDAPAAAAPVLQAATGSASSPTGSASGWGWWDSVVSGLAAAALMGIVLPAILRGRFEARKMVCQDHLRDLGIGMTAYALSDPGQQLPQLATEGPEAFAGVFAVRLRQSQLIDDASTLWCPSTERPHTPDGLPALPPTLEQLHAAANGPMLGFFQGNSGGSYAYTLGVMEGERYRAPRYRGRTSFAVLGDAPTTLAAGAATQTPHDRRGVNLLYEDGHVAFMPHAVLETAADPPFVNHRGEVEAGVDADDATLAPSAFPPFTFVRQR